MRSFAWLGRVLSAMIAGVTLLVLTACGTLSQNSLNATSQGTSSSGGPHEHFPPNKQVVRAGRRYCPEALFPFAATTLARDIEAVRRVDPALAEALGPGRRELRGTFGEPRPFFWAVYRATADAPLPEACQVFMEARSLDPWSILRPRGAPEG